MSEAVAQTELEVGDRVVDVESEPDEQNPAVVLSVTNLRAHEYVVDVGQTVADYNGDEYRDDQVVVVAFEKWLDSTTNRTWRSVRPSDLSEFVTTFCAEWKLPRQEYAYPASRLEAGSQP